LENAAMKSFLFLSLGILLGAYLVHLYDQRETPGVGDEARTLSSGPGGTLATARESIGQKMVQWHLTSDDVKSELASTGRVVRANAEVAGAKIADARIVTVIKAKYLLDRDISAIDISVDVHDGRVVLSGRVASEEIIGRAMELALETEGVSNVVSLLRIRPLN